MGYIILSLNENVSHYFITNLSKWITIIINKIIKIKRNLNKNFHSRDVTCRRPARPRGQFGGRVVGQWRWLRLRLASGIKNEHQVFSKCYDGFVKRTPRCKNSLVYSTLYKCCFTLTRQHESIFYYYYVVLIIVNLGLFRVGALNH